MSAENWTHVFALLALLISLVAAVVAIRDSRQNHAHWIQEMEFNRHGELSEKREAAITRAKGVTVAWESGSDFCMNLTTDSSPDVYGRPTVRFNIEVDNPADVPIHDVVIVSGADTVLRLLNHRYYKYSDGRVGFQIGHIGARGSRHSNIELFLPIEHTDSGRRVTNTHRQVFEVVFRDIEGTLWATKNGFNSRTLESKTDPLEHPMLYFSQHSVNLPEITS